MSCIRLVYMFIHIYYHVLRETIQMIISDFEDHEIISTL